MTQKNINNNLQAIASGVSGAVASETNEKIGTIQEPVAAIPNTAPKQSVAEMEAEIKALELEEKRLAVKFAKANLEDMQERLDERQIKRENVRQTSVTNGTTLKQTNAIDVANQKRCNHRKGGNEASGYIGGQGDSPQYAVIKHTFANGDQWVRCQRCGKTWKPPVESEHLTKESYTAALAIYKEAISFPTQNKNSSSVVFQFSDGGEFYREVTKDASLR
jgi:hypothetical protein